MYIKKDPKDYLPRGPKKGTKLPKKVKTKISKSMMGKKNALGSKRTAEEKKHIGEVKVEWHLNHPNWKQTSTARKKMRAAWVIRRKRMKDEKNKKNE